MAMGKNRTGIMAAITAAAEASNAPGNGRDRAHRTLPKGTIGSVRAGLGGIQEIDTDLIIPWGPTDRLDVELTAVNSAEALISISELADSIAASGQQIPVLLRPSTDRDGHFEVVYGRRRILACRQLGVRVKALIRTLDDTEALMAKGLENASRSDLSFYERARFAQAILDQGYERADTIRALAISKSTLSQLERVTRHVPERVGDGIGAAPSAGRPKWMVLAAAFEKGQMSESQALEVLARCDADAGSDNKLEALLNELNRRGAQERIAPERIPMPGVHVKSAKSSLSLTVKKSGESEAFANWLDRNLDRLIKESFARFQSENPGG